MICHKKKVQVRTSYMRQIKVKRICYNVHCLHLFASERSGFNAFFVSIAAVRFSSTFSATSIIQIVRVTLVEFITARKRSCEKVMFSQASVCSQEVGQVTSNVSWDKSHGRMPPGHQTLGPLLVASGGDHWRPVQTCSFRDPLQSDIWWWPLKRKHVRFPSGLYPSHWNAFLLSKFFSSIQMN